MDTAITLPVGVEAYAAYALRAWLARDRVISSRTRRFAKWSSICSFALGMAGQVAYHLLALAGMARAPWPITTIVSCLPVLVLAMGTALAHMLRADAEAVDAPGSGPGAASRLAVRVLVPGGPGRTGPRTAGGCPGPVRVAGPARSRAGTTTWPWNHGTWPAAHRATGGSGPRDRPRLAAAGKPVSRRALRSGGVTGSNEALNALARMLTAELARCADSG